jgi:hypothetical protein
MINRSPGFGDMNAECGFTSFRKPQSGYPESIHAKGSWMPDNGHRRFRHDEFVEVGQQWGNVTSPCTFFQL